MQQVKGPFRAGRRPAALWPEYPGTRQMIEAVLLPREAMNCRNAQRTPTEKHETPRDLIPPGKVSRALEVGNAG